MPRAALQDELAHYVTLENGKTLADAQGSIFRGLEVVEAAAGIAPFMMGETVENVASGIDCYSVRQPLGVVAGICPFNFPAMVPLWMFPMACTAGVAQCPGARHTSSGAAAAGAQPCSSSCPFLYGCAVFRTYSCR